ncbi:unnamed protein product [Thelazia callipaeda]|uniref:DUF4456 domain-containing protein n=1 Tax=Thelazia callipaeda TaxID=103827 RepID=A0A0N5CK00_THECL|nr:unnamed protein product [Thelazia callipaeda]
MDQNPQIETINGCEQKDAALNLEQTAQLYHDSVLLKITRMNEILRIKEINHDYLLQESMHQLQNELSMYPGFIAHPDIVDTYELLLNDLSLYSWRYHALSRAFLQKDCSLYMSELDKLVEERKMDFRKTGSNFANFQIANERILTNQEREKRSLLKTEIDLDEKLNALTEQVGQLQQDASDTESSHHNIQKYKADLTFNTLNDILQLQQADSVMTEMKALIYRLKNEDNYFRKKYSDMVQKMNVMMSQMIKLLVAEEKEKTTENETLQSFVEEISKIANNYFLLFKDLRAKIPEKQYKSKLANLLQDLFKLVFKGKMELEDELIEDSESLEQKSAEQEALEKSLQKRGSELKEKIAHQVRDLMKKYRTADIHLAAVFFNKTKEMIIRNEISLFDSMIEELSDYRRRQQMLQSIVKAEMDDRKKMVKSIFRAHFQCEKELYENLNKDTTAIWTWFQDAYNHVYELVNSKAKVKVSKIENTLKKLMDCLTIVEKSSLEDWPILVCKLQEFLNNGKEKRGKKKDVAKNVVCDNLEVTEREKVGEVMEALNVSESFCEEFSDQEIEETESGAVYKTELQELRKVMQFLSEDLQFTCTTQQEILQAMRCMENLKSVVEIQQMNLNVEAYKKYDILKKFLNWLVTENEALNKELEERNKRIKQLKRIAENFQFSTLERLERERIVEERQKSAGSNISIEQEIQKFEERMKMQPQLFSSQPQNSIAHLLQQFSTVLSAVSTLQLQSSAPQPQLSTTQPQHSSQPKSTPLLKTSILQPKTSTPLSQTPTSLPQPSPQMQPSPPKPKPTASQLQPSTPQPQPCTSQLQSSIPQLELSTPQPQLSDTSASAKLSSTSPFLEQQQSSTSQLQPLQTRMQRTKPVQQHPVAKKRTSKSKH